MIKITAVDPQDLPAILRIERLGFNEAEAGYEKNGYVNQGIAASAHAGEVWYNMTKLLPSQPQPLG